MRSILVLLAAAGILIGGTLAIRSLAPSAGSDAMELDTEGGGTTETPTVEEEAEVGSDESAGIEHSRTVGEGTWTVSAVASAVADPGSSDAAAAVSTGADPRHQELPDRGRGRAQLRPLAADDPDLGRPRRVPRLRGRP